MFFPVVMYGCENWTIKKAEHWRIDALELWCWRRLPRVPWTARRSNQLILKESNPEYSLEGLMLKLKLQYFGHPMQRTDSLEKIRMLGKIEGRRTRGWQRMRWLDGITDSMAISLSPFRETVKDRGAWHGAVHGVAKNWTRLKCLNNHNKAKEYYSPILDAWGWCTGMTQRDGMGREEGGGFRMGNACIPVVDSFWYMAKPIQYCKVKKYN